MMLIDAAGPSHQLVCFLYYCHAT